MKDIYKAFMWSMETLVGKLGSIKAAAFIFLTVLGFIAMLCKYCTFTQWSLQFEIPLVTLLFTANQTQKYIHRRQDKPPFEAPEA